MITLFQENQAKMRLCRRMIGTDRERVAIRLNGRRRLPSGAQRIAQIVSDIAVFGLPARGAAAHRDRLIVAAESPERVAEIARICGAARRLDRVAEGHEMLAQALEALDRAVIEASEAEEKLNVAAEALSFEPARLDAVETRLFELRAIARKHQVEPDALPELLEKLAAKLDALEGGAASIAKLEAAEARAAAHYVEAADALTQARMACGGRLDKAVAGELAPLKLDAARFQTMVGVLPPEQWGPRGKDHVEFLISTNPGAPFAPLAKIASGGELSRFILALKVALAEEGGAETIIFDEIDRGVGGAVASAIGERLSRLSRRRQLLAVTHSPQVAATGANHFFIAKSSDGTVTRTGVHELGADERRQEIARMLSGAEVTDEARAQADRLLEKV